MIELALASGIPPAVWGEEGERAIVTALELLDQAQRDQDDDDGRQLSG